MSVDGKWMCSLEPDNETWVACEYFDSREEAIEMAKAEIKKAREDFENSCVIDTFGEEPESIEELGAFAIGRCENLTTGVYSMADQVIEMVAEEVYAEVGEPAEDYLTDVLPEHKEELDTIISLWFKRHGYTPEYYKIVDIEVIEVEED